LPPALLVVPPYDLAQDQSDDEYRHTQHNHAQARAR
jgi:hypothetical protein